MAQIKHYGFYLNAEDPDDALMISYLERYVRTRRVGAVVRQAVGDFMKRAPGQSSMAAPVYPSLPPIPFNPPDRSGIVTLAAPTDVVGKAKKAFFK